MLPEIVGGQIITLTGHVYNAIDSTGIEMAGIRIKNTVNGTVTDEDGRFFIQTPAVYDTLIITYVGFRQELRLLTDSTTQNFIVYLKPENFDLNEVIIKPREDPAKVLMEKVIAHKKQNDQQNINEYKARGYNKIELDVGNLTVAADTNKAINPFAILREHIDDTSDITPFLPFFFTETVSDFYFRKTPKTKKEIIIASRTSGINNPSITQVLGNYYEQFNIYDNYWYLLSKNFVPPITDSWNFFYKIELVDSAYIDNDWCYKLNFTPRQKQENVFDGYMWIADGSFAVKEVFMQLDSSANINYCKRAVFYQRFDNIDDSLWTISFDNLLAEFTPRKGAATIIARKTTIYSQYYFDKGIYDEVAQIKDDIVYNDSVINNDESFWNNVRPIPLSNSEKSVYLLVDSLKNIKQFTTLVDVYNTLMYGYWNLGYVRIGPLANIISQDEVEGVRLRLGAKTGDLISKRMTLGGYLAYGFQDNKFKYGTDFNLVITKKPWQQLKFSYENDLDVNSNESVAFGEDNILSGLYRRRSTPQKIIDRERFKWYYEKEWIWGISNSLTVTSTHMHPMFDIYYYNQHDSLVKDINNAEINLGLRFAYREKFLFDNYRRYSIGTKYPVLKFNYRMGIPDLAASDFTYHAFEISLEDYFTMATFGGITYSIKTGKIVGTLPTLLLESPPGNETYFFNHGTFNLMNEYEFVMDSYAELFLTYSMWGLLLNKIPLIQKLKWREVATFKMVYGELSEANRAANNYLKETDPYFIGNSAPGPIPYMEAGVGVENVFKLFRVDAIWRLTHRDNPLAPNFGVRVGVSLDI
ncbi:MAG: DUF5686 family protein [Chitinophagales bacterium]